MQKWFSALTLLFLCKLASGQIWDLQKCISHAFEKNLDIQVGQLQLDIAKNNQNQSKLDRLPSLSMDANHNYNLGRAIDPFTNTFSNQSIQTNRFSLSSGITLFNGFRINNNIRRQNLSYQIAGSSLKVVKNNVALSVANAYLQVLFSIQQKKIALKQEERTNVQLNRIQKLYDAGVIDPSQILTLEAQLAQDQVNLVNAENLIKSNYVRLKNLLQIPIEENFSVLPPESIEIEISNIESLTTIYQTAENQMPQIELVEKQAEQANLDIQLARATMLPTLSSFYSLQTVYSQSNKSITDFNPSFDSIGFVNSTNDAVLVQRLNGTYMRTPYFDQLSNNVGQSIGFSLRIPIFNQLSNRNRWQNAKIQAEIAEKNQENAKNTLRLNVAQAYTDYLNAAASLQASKENQRIQEKNYALIQQRFEAGLANSFDLLLAKNNLESVISNNLRAQYDFLFRKLILDFYQGKALKL